MAEFSEKTRKNLTDFLRHNSAAIVVLVLLILFPFVMSLITGQPANEGKPKFWEGQLINFFIMAVYAMSYDLLMGYTGILSFGHAAFFGAGAYAMALWLSHVAPMVSSKYRMTLPGGIDITETILFIIAIVLVIIIAILMGLFFSGASMRVKGVYFAMITLAIAEAFHILSKATDFVKWTGADEGLHGVPVPLWINPTQHRLKFYFIALFFMVLMYLFLKRVTESTTGRVFLALRENENRVRMIGYNPATYRSLAFVISSIAAGLSGAMFSLWNMSATPTMTSAVTTINALIMTILGGVGTLMGPILGAGLMQVFSQFFYQWFGARWPLVFGLIFIALVVFLPYGIVGTYRLRQPDIKTGWTRFRNLFSVKK
jgi:branched-chain amino acid transport system permease protein